MNVRLSILIKCYQDERIFDCLESIDMDCEVIVSYAGKTRVYSKIAGRYPNVKVVRAPKGNLSISCSLGMHESTGNSVLIMDSDSKFESGSLDLIVQHLEG